MEQPTATVSPVKARETFYFMSRLNLTELTGRQARDLAEFLENLKTVPGSVIYHHTHHFIQQHQSLSPEPPNDFAFWVTTILQEDVLGERLAAIDIVQFPTIRSLQERIIATVESYLNTHPNLRAAPPGEEFHFMKSVTFVIPTPYQATTLEEFLDAMQKISIQSIYYHMFEARLRLGKPGNDFSLWLESELNEKALADAIGGLDPYTHTLEGLKETICRMIAFRLKELAHA